MTADLEVVERRLRELGALLASPAERDLAPAVMRRLERAPRRRLALPWVLTRRSVAIAIALTLVASGIAVASYFGVRGVRVRVGETPPPTATAGAGVNLNLGESLALAAAREQVAFPVGVPAALGSPDETYLNRGLPGYGVTLLYRPRPGLPAAGGTKAGLLLFAFVGEVERDAFHKFVQAEQVTEVTVGGERGLWIEGAHTIAWLSPSGGFASDTVRLAGSVLLWQRGEVTMRLESGLAMAEAIRIAESVR